jgi:protein arginine N-methyltransferase 5
MDYSEGMDESFPVFYIGQHESKRTLHVSPELVQHAQDLGVSESTTYTKDPG